MNPKTFIIAIGLIIILSAFVNLGNFWEYCFMLVDVICWEVVYVVLTIAYIQSVGHRNCLKWANFVYSALLSIILASGLLDIVYQAYATVVRIEVGTNVRGWDYYSEAARLIDKGQPLYICSHNFTLGLVAIVLFLFIFCSGWLYGKK